MDLTEVMFVGNRFITWRRDWSEPIHTAIMALSFVNALLVEADTVLRLLRARRVISSFGLRPLIGPRPQGMVFNILHI